MSGLDTNHLLVLAAALGWAGGLRLCAVVFGGDQGSWAAAAGHGLFQAGAQALIRETNTMFKKILIAGARHV